MTDARTVGGWTGDRLAHEAFVFDDDTAVRDRCLPFVTEALDHGQPVVVMAGGRVRAILADELGDRSGELVLFGESEKAWLGGGGTLAAYQETMEPLRAAGRPWRLVGEPVWLSEPDGAQWSRFEAVANDAFADYPYYSLCLHDRRRLASPLVEGQLRVHPLVWDGAQPVPNPAYVPTEEFLRSVEPAWCPPPSGTEAVRIEDVRAALPTLTALTGRVAGDRRQETLLAVYELVTNALRAAGTAEVRHWGQERTTVWEVTADGPGLHDVRAGYRPPGTELACGRGLWLARSLADDASVRPTGPGTAVRLYFRD